MDYNVSNDAIAELDVPLTVSSSTIILKAKGNLFPASDFVVKIEQFDTLDTSKVVYRENFLISTRSGNTLNISARMYEPVPQSSEATTQTSEKLTFSSWSVVTQVLSAKMWEDLQNNFLLYPKKSQNETITGEWDFQGRLSAKSFLYRWAIGLDVWANLDNITDAGFYDVYNATSPNSVWLPSGYLYLTVERYRWDGSFFHQVVTTFGTGNTANQMYTRCKYAWTSWTSWERLIVWGVPKLRAVPQIHNILPKVPSDYVQQFTLEWNVNNGWTWSPQIPNISDNYLHVITFSWWSSIEDNQNVIQFAYWRNWSEHKRIGNSNDTWGPWIQQNRIIKPSTSIIFELADFTNSVDSTTVKWREAVLNTPWTYKISFRIKWDTGSGTCSCQVRKNGTTIYTWYYDDSDGWIIRSFDYAFAAGDIVSFWGVDDWDNAEVSEIKVMWTLVDYTVNL